MSDTTSSTQSLKDSRDPAGRLELRCRRSDALPDELTPLALPEELTLQLHDVTGDLVDHLHLELELALSPGRHTLPVTEREPLVLEVPDEAQMELWLSANRGLDPTDGQSMITACELVFEPAVTVHNLWPVLGQLPTIFADRDLAAVRDKVERMAHSPAAESALLLGLDLLSRLEQRMGKGDGEKTSAPERMSELRERLGSQARQIWSELQGGMGLVGEELSRRAGQLPVVLLRRVSGRPVLHRGGWQLQLRFSGELGYPGRAMTRFSEVALPTTVLPAPRARLSELLSEDPLATANLRSSRLPLGAVARALGRLIAGCRGHLEAQLQAPAVCLRMPTPTLGESLCELRHRGQVRLRGGLEAQVSPERVALGLHGLEIATGSARMSAEAGLVLLPRDGVDLPSGAVLSAVLEAMVDRRLPGDLVHAALEVTLGDQSVLEGVDVHASLHHPCIDSGSGVALTFHQVRLAGRLALDTDQPEGESVITEVDLRYGAEVELPEGSRLADGVLSLAPRLSNGRVEGRITRTEQGGMAVQVEAKSGFAVEGETRVEAFPELDIDEGVLVVRARGDVSVEGRLRTGPITGRLMTLELDGTQGEVHLAEGELALGRRSLHLPGGSRLGGRVSEGHLSTSGLGRALVELHWDLQGRSPVLRAPGHEVEIFVPELRQGRIGVSLSPVGGVTISGERQGLYDARFWNALVNPGAEAERWIEILDDDDAMDKVLGALRVFSAKASDQLAWVRDLAKRVRRILNDEGIRQPGDFIPGRTMARVFSQVLVEDTSLEEVLYPLVKQVTDGRGLDMVAVKRILGEHLPEHEYHYELDRALRLAARLLAPTEPLPPREMEELVPLAEAPGYRLRYQALPDGGSIYRILSDPAPLQEEFAWRVARVAPYLGLAQLEWILAVKRLDWPAAALRRLRTVLALKERVQEIAESYGGIAFVPQAWAISFFLGEAVRPRGGQEELGADPDLGYPLAEGLLGPWEVAVLLQSGLATIWQGGPMQVNQRLLIDYALRQPKGFLRDVLVEMAGRGPRALTGVLYALIQLEQGRLREPLDIPAVLSEELGVPVPPIADYMAGGRWARESHYEALSRAAERILSESEPYFALLERLRFVRHPVTSAEDLATRHRKLARAAQDAIAKADRLAERCTFGAGAKEAAGRRAASEAYEAAFAACTALCQADPEAFGLPWFKAFWARNHEALVVRSVVRNVQDDVDEVRFWLRVRSGAEVPAEEQALVDAVIDALYFFEADRAQLKGDPLVRLLLGLPAGHYDFTIISAMGVITEGARGNELQEAYRRIEEKRGVRTIRADTQTARSLDFNAARIKEAVQKAEGPWGYIGYSQGCANGLRAEALLLSGTPEEQALVSRLRARNLLFSATNGSAHGTCGDWKFLQAMIDGDRFLKHYQAVFSAKAIRLALSNIGLLLDSRPFIHSLGGVDSLSHVGVAALARDGQWRSDVPTSIVRGIVEHETLPEALEMLSNVLTLQIESADHDTQVTTTEAQGYPVWARSPMAKVLERCDMGCLVQRTHHWSPLKDATAFVTTKRDRERAIYDFPKDRHVFPWVEVNARFGIIRRR